MDSILEGMKRTLGESGTKYVVSYLRRYPAINDLHGFHKRLLSIFGQEGTQRLELAMISELYLRLGTKYKSEDPVNDPGRFNFEECTSYAKHAFSYNQTM